MAETAAPGPERVAERAVALTPMLRHYLEVKAQYPDSLLLYRMGDFYELFFEDAVRAAPVLEVALTARQRGTPSEAPMCGVPHHAIEGYLAKLLDAGRKVVICDQVEDPAQAQGLVRRPAQAQGLMRREVTRVVTPGTVSDLDLLDGKRANLLAALEFVPDGSGAAAFLDLSTGEFWLTRADRAEQLVEDLDLAAPRELLLPQPAPPAVLRWLDRTPICHTTLERDLALSPAQARADLLDQLGVGALDGFGLPDDEPAVRAAAHALRYARTAARVPLVHVRSLRVRSRDTFEPIDEATARNLELFENQRDRRRGATLWSVVDWTLTSAGGRLLYDWLAHPLRDQENIQLRHEAVAELYERAELRAELRRGLGRVADLERLVARAVLGTMAPREAAALRDSLRAAPDLLRLLAPCLARSLLELRDTDPLCGLAGLLAAALDETPAGSLKDGVVINNGFDAPLDELRALARDGKRLLLALEARERETTGISSLKVRFNRVFGYSIEITRSHQAAVPAHYLRKQTLANAERYTTDELKQLEGKILDAEERLVAVEQRLFDELRRAVAAQAIGVRELAYALATLDVFAGYAELAVRHDYCRPRMLPPGGPLVVKDGRHPVVERRTAMPFVANDVELDPAGAQIVVLTGPNMGGKSTYLRQVALLVLLAQAGSFVPARSAEVSIVDRIFTRVGASDDLARGQSTFMVEMTESAYILRYAGPASLVILDEVGRGTATFDGLSLAWAMVEHLHQHCGAKTLFATHYHELTELEATLPRVRNRCMAVKEWQDRILFLHRVAEGSADKSYGIQVARLAGLPDSVLRRAAEVLANLESQEYDWSGQPRRARGANPGDGTPGQMPLFLRPEDVVADLLRELDLERVTPIAALNLLETLKQRLGSIR